jgi:hypothetical protein
MKPYRRYRHLLQQALLARPRGQFVAGAHHHLDQEGFDVGRYGGCGVVVMGELAVRRPVGAHVGEIDRGAANAHGASLRVFFGGK